MYSQLTQSGWRITNQRTQNWRLLTQLTTTWTTRLRLHRHMLGMAERREGHRSCLMRLKMAAVLPATNQETAISSAGPIRCSHLFFITCVPSGEQLIVQGQTNYKIWPQGHNTCTYICMFCMLHCIMNVIIWIVFCFRSFIIVSLC